MVKLASARESRTYGPRLAQSRAEYMNAGLYLFSTIVLICGFAAEFSREPRSGLVLMLIALGLIILVNIHDLLAHLAGIDYRFTLMGFDPQLALVEFSVPLVQILGSLLLFLGILFLFIQAEKGYGFFKLERHALGMLIAGPVLWVAGSIHNSCQIYERADAHVQILQQCPRPVFNWQCIVHGGSYSQRPRANWSYSSWFTITGKKMGVVRDMWERNVYDRGVDECGKGVQDAADERD
ncbi:hypothetical protein ES319_D09G198800v1 [Gossypium barbadense]|uniref:Uncharacterized protein n=2 Tax=Gossypium TaxID=3633 RepID=A0A5J5Q6C8_GOSBA|nr:hypothetical protein ES319_D09G198800v1 [Gossypium barbadense]TYG54758.1 hypothetical protein ES288_D09G216800v1 [Gossypium darwinii]